MNRSASSPRRARGSARLSFALAAGVVLADQLSKAWASRVLAVQGPRPLIPGLLDLHFTTNTGAAFSLLSGSTRLLGLISVLVALVVVVWILRQARRPMPLSRSLGLGLVLGGALGNGIDRWRLGEVVDFLALVPVSFPIFNIADVAINLAVLAFALELLLPQPSGDA